jgi:hypothetical protein
MRTGQVILRVRRLVDWAGFIRDGMLQRVGRQTRDGQPTATDLELLAPFVALQPASLLEALDQGLDADRTLRR